MKDCLATLLPPLAIALPAIVLSLSLLLLVIRYWKDRSLGKSEDSADRRSVSRWFTEDSGRGDVRAATVVAILLALGAALDVLLCLATSGSAQFWLEGPMLPILLCIAMLLIFLTVLLSPSRRRY